MVSVDSGTVKISRGTVNPTTVKSALTRGLVDERKVYRS